MKHLDFLKIHGIGNDFILVDGRKINLDYKPLALKLCPRHFSIGADGLIILENANNYNNDYKMRIFNPDGSEAEMCGNGIRTLIHFIKYLGINNKKNYNIETKAGIIRTEVLSYNDKFSKIKVNMGKAKFHKDKIPANVDNKSEINDHKVIINGNEVFLNSLSIGNPHTVVYVNNIDEVPLVKWGKEIENHEIFPDNTNVEFVKIINKNNLEMRVWERGVGETLACGTGACASAVMSAKKGYTSNNVNVKLKGGNLKINLKDDIIYMTGNAKLVFEGKVKIE
ncbi:MAG TPA: diaminopimelate epimerase [Halanaerobiales bacterium]|nr:diaminopimelate epimerase [Halanaerobiales bacterium]